MTMSVDQTPTITGHAATICLLEALGSLGIQITSAREAIALDGSPGVRIGTMTVTDVMALVAVINREVSRREAAATLNEALAEAGVRVLEGEVLSCGSKTR